MSHVDIAPLVASAQHGDRKAIERVVAEELADVRAVALHYRNIGLSVDDLVQEGSLGLLDAIETFDPARGVDFEVYARFRIRRAVRNALTEQSRTIRLPKQIVERRRVLDRAEARLAAARGHLPTAGELAADTGLSEEAVIEARGAATAGLSLDQPLLPDGSLLDSLIADAGAASPEQEAVERERADAVDEAVATLPARAREVITRHFGLGRSTEPIASVAADLHVSPQRARTIERAALSTLRDRLDPQPPSSSSSR